MQLPYDARPQRRHEAVRCRDGVNVLWCRSHLVWLVVEGSIPTCTCFHSENFFVTLHIQTSTVVPPVTIYKPVQSFRQWQYTNQYSRSASDNIQTSTVVPLVTIYKPVQLFRPWQYTNQYSCSASDNIRTIIERTESVYVQKFQCSINGTSSSGKFLESLANKRETVCTYLARLLLLCVGKPLFTNGLIVPCVRGMRFRLACFVSPPLSYMKQVPFKSAGIRLQNMQKLSVYTAQGLRYILWYANQKIAVDACMCKVSSITIHPRSD